MATRLTRFIVENTHFTALLAVIILTYGFTSLSRINISQDPNIDIPEIHIRLFLNGATPDRLERNVIFPIEAELRSIHGITLVRSYAEHDSAAIFVRFQHHFATEDKLRELETAINQIKRKLPDDLDYTLVNFTTSELLVAFLLTFNAPSVNPEQEEAQARDLVTALHQVDHLRNIRLIQAEQEVVVEFDTAKLNRYGISVENAQQEIVAQNSAAVSGNLALGNDYLRFTGPDSAYRTIAAIETTVLYGAGGKALALSEVARVYRRDQGDNTISARHDGRDTLLIAIGVDIERANILAVKQDLLQAIVDFKRDFEQPPEITLVFDQAREVNSLLWLLVTNFFQGLAILFVVLLFAVDWRSTLIITSLVPFAFLTALIFLSFTSFGIQQVSLAGFIIALGLMVDNAIVVTEGTFILQRYKGYTRRQATIEGTAEALGPLIASTLTTVLAFAPVFLIASNTTLYLRSLSVSIALSLVASLLVAVTFTVLLLARLGTIGRMPLLPPVPSYLNALIPFRDRVYLPLLRVVIRWRLMTLILFVLLLGGALVSARNIPLEVFPLTGIPYFTVNVDLPKNQTEPAKRRLIEQIEQTLRLYPEVEAITSVSGALFPYLNVAMDFQGDIVFLVKTRQGDEGHLVPLKAALEQRLKPLAKEAAINVALFKFEDAVYRAPLTLQISGPDSRRLRAYAHKLHEPFKTVPGVRILENPARSSQLGFRLQFRYEDAARYSISKRQVDPYIVMLTYGLEIDRFYETSGEEYPLLIKLSSDPRAVRDSLRRIIITGADGDQVPLSEVLELSLYESEGHIQHLDFRPVMELNFWLQPGYSAETVAAALLDAAERAGIDPGIRVEVGGALARKTQDFTGFGNSVLLVAAVIFAVFVLQFRSIMQPMIVFSVIPFCLIGIIAGLLITGFPITFFAVVGAASLMGIVVNDSILLVDQANRLGQSDPGLSIKERAVLAAGKRFMPILLTSVTTNAALLPMAIVDSPFRIMAISIIGGLTSSTVLLLVLVPILYSYLSPANSTPATSI